MDWPRTRPEQTAEGMTSADEAEFEVLYRAESGPLLRYLTRRLHSASDAEEVLQDTFIQFRKVERSERVEHAHALLVRIATNLAIDRLRQNRSRANRERHWSDHRYRSESAGGAMGEVAPSQLQSLHHRQRLQRLLKLLESLSPKVRQAFILHKFDNLTHREVADRMGLAQSTVEKHIMKALKHLLAGMDKE
ncbi:MAG: sigma-70 family RNA polymerase sigma factor [Alphaproteobacteria bacterium]|nr:sigma-70 family RNA polymerase sigma factor [Alphaproteobacteria bacterium]